MPGPRKHDRKSRKIRFSRNLKTFFFRILHFYMFFEAPTLSQQVMAASRQRPNFSQVWNDIRTEGPPRTRNWNDPTGFCEFPEFPEFLRFLNDLKRLCRCGHPHPLVRKVMRKALRKEAMTRATTRATTKAMTRATAKAVTTAGRRREMRKLKLWSCEKRQKRHIRHRYPELPGRLLSELGRLVTGNGFVSSASQKRHGQNHTIPCIFHVYSMRISAFSKRTCHVAIARYIFDTSFF